MKPSPATQSPQVLGSSPETMGSVLSASLEESVIQTQGREMGFQIIRN